MNTTRDISRRIAAGAMAAALFCGMTVSVAAENEPATAAQAETVAEGKYEKVIAPQINNTTDEKSDVDLQTALTKVKQRINIPDSYDDFSYRRSENRGAVSYTFTWSMLKTDSENSINVSITGDYITSFNKYSANDYEAKPSFGKLSEKELTDKADKLITQLNPSVKGKYKLEFSGASLLGHYSDFIATRVENGVELGENSVSISLDKDTGELKSMNVNWWGNATFVSPSKKITAQEASEAFRKNITYAPRYHIVYDNETEKSSAVLIYYPDDFESLDALTGKVSSMYEDMKKALDTASYSNGASAADIVAVAEEAAPTSGSGSERSVTFTKAEKDAMLKNKELISQADAEKIVKSDKYMMWTKDYILESAELDRSDDGYAWRISYIVRSDDDYRSIYAYIDAKTGAVKSFSRYSNDDYKNGSIKYDEAKADALAEEAYKYYMGKRADEYRLNESNDDDIMLIAKKPAGKSYRYTRHVNGLPCDDNCARVSVGKDGTVKSFSYTYTDVKFPSAERITEDEAKDALLEAKMPVLDYSGFTDMKGNAKTYLLYSLESCYINAKTGELCDYDGKPVTKDEKDEKTEYTDIKGNFAENCIRKLYEYGITLECKDGKFNPSAAITEDEFRKLISEIIRADEPIWLDAASRKNTDKIKYADFVTREDAAVILVTAAGGDTIARMSGIFKNDFKDIRDNDENLGYIAVACGMNVMAKDGNGNFNPDVKITRARAMEMAYLYIQNLNA